MMGKQGSDKLEWRINVNDEKSETLVPESGILQRIFLCLNLLLKELILKLWNFFKKAWDVAVSDPRKVIHGLKVGVALSVVSVFYYMRPLYEGVGGNAMWAVMTVVVVFEYTVGATLSKSINRATGTFLAGSLGVGVHWIASKSGNEVEPYVRGISVFIFASTATFSRFVPSVKARFDYGAMIFILTFSLVSVSGYRVDKLVDMAHQRLSTIVIGTSLCIITSMLFCPIWAGDELHSLMHRNLEKLADSLDACVGCYFTDDMEEDCSKKMEGYKCVLNSKATEDSMANFARWEPAHGRFNFKHPWKQYLQVGASMRSCAYCVETLNSCINSEIQAPEHLKKHLSNARITLSSCASTVLKDLATTMKTMTVSPTTDISITEMQCAAQDLQNSLKSLPNYLTGIPSPTLDNDSQAERIVRTSPTIIEVLPLATLISLLLETASRIQEITDAVNELAKLADFCPAADELDSSNHDQEQTVKTLPKV